MSFSHVSVTIHKSGLKVAQDAAKSSILPGAAIERALSRRTEGAGLCGWRQVEENS